MSYDKSIYSYKTPSRLLLIEKYDHCVDIEMVRTDSEYFFHLCKYGCINFLKKYSCPPHSPVFSDYCKGYSNIRVLCYKLDLNQYSDQRAYNRIRAANSVLKSIIDKELRSLKATGKRVLGSGSCRACKVCGAKTLEGCKKPNSFIYSLESVGIDVNHLVETIFGFSLQWYKKNEGTPDYTCVVGGVLYK